MVRFTAVALLAACGGGGSPGGIGSGSVSGTVGAVTFGSIVEAASFSYAGADCHDASAQIASAYISLSTTAGHCAAFQAAGKQPAGDVLILGVNRSGSSAQAAIAPGTYSVVFLGNPSGFGIAGTLTSAGCESASYLSASGTVTLTSVSGSGMAGSFNINFVDGSGNPAGTLTGSFDAANCPVDTSKFCASTASAAQSC